MYACGRALPFGHIARAEGTSHIPNGIMKLSADAAMICSAGSHLVSFWKAGKTLSEYPYGRWLRIYEAS